MTVHLSLQCLWQNRLTLPLMLCLTMPFHSSAAVIFVDHAAPGPTHDGTSWSSAFQSIQLAVESAAVGDSVWVAKGTYSGTILLRPGVWLFGGFTGSETFLVQRDPLLHQTLISGDRIRRAITIMPDDGAPALLDGFIVQDGASSGGGGILIFGPSSPVIRNSVIRRNTAERGAGILVEYRATPVIERNVIAHNAANAGAGIEFWTQAGGIVRNNLFIGNSADWGSAILSTDRGAPLIYNNTIVGQEAGPAVEFWATSPGSLINNIIAFNRGGVVVRTGGGITFRNNNVFGNTGGNFGGGGISDPTGTIGNISEDPLFVGNYRLQPGSPSIDSGDSSVVQPGERDLDGKPRIYGAAVDMGAYEWTPALSVADVALALKITGGLAEARWWEVDRLRGEGPPVVDLPLAARLIRSVAGLE
jgi:parallel beta-helix repeat protein